MLLDELLMAVPDLVQPTQLADPGSIETAYSKTYGEAYGKTSEGLIETVKLQGTRTFPVFVISLTCAPEDMMFENRQLVAADQRAAVILQLVPETGEAIE